MMKQLLAALLALTLLAGCAANPAAPDPEPVSPDTTVTEPETSQDTGSQTETPAGESDETEEESFPIGSFTAESISGETLDQTYFSGANLTVINIWATYCGPCKEEMPILATLHEELAGDVQFLGIVTDCTDANGDPIPDQVELAVDLAETAGCTYPNLILNTDLATLGFASLSAVPATLFVDQTGSTVGYGFYGALDEDSWRETIQDRLETVRARNPQ